METRARDVQPEPADSTVELRRARSEAVDAILEAERLEGQARKARRRATALNRNYERLLLEHQHDGGLFREGGA